MVVIPGGPETCRALKLEPLPPDYAAAASALGRAKAVLMRDADLHPRSRAVTTRRRSWRAPAVSWPRPARGSSR